MAPHQCKAKCTVGDLVLLCTGMQEADDASGRPALIADLRIGGVW